MKRYGNLFSQIIDIDNLLLAHRNARRGKSYYREVQLVDSDPEYYCSVIRDALISKTFTTSEYTEKEIYEPKQRTIYKLPYYPDRIVHHAVMQVIQPIWDRVFITDLYSAIPGKGLHAGSYRLRKFMKDNPGTQYCLKFDVSKFYPSMNHEVLLSLIEKKIKCKETLWLLADVIRSTSGVPIGNYLSQYFGNIYLNEFDHWIKEENRMKYYIRYCDDGVILHSDKFRLKQLLEDIRTYFDSIHLKLNPKTSIFPVDKCGIDFLGYRHFRKYILLRKSSVRNLKRRVHEIGSLSSSSAVSSIMSSVGWLEHCDSYHLLSRYFLNNGEIQKVMELYSEQHKGKNPLFMYRRKHAVF